MHGQLFLLGVSGTKLTSSEATLFRDIQPGGFVLFSRNIQAPEQVRRLTDELRDICVEPPIIAIDQEGGRVTRTKELGIHPPSAYELRKKGDLSLIARHGLITADVLHQLGCNMNFAPVLDISYDDNADNALRGRCYGTDSQEVITNAGIFNRNLRHQKILSCGKHFPSCGLANIDPHHGLPVSDKTIEEMLKSDLIPYTALMPELDAIMTSHVHFSAIDSEGIPSSFSRKLVHHLLRNQLGYDGVIMTDDLDMGAIVTRFGRGSDVSLAIKSGNDMAMICHQVASAPEALERLKEIPTYTIDDSLRRIEKLKKKLKQPFPFSETKWNIYVDETRQLRRDTLGTDEVESSDDSRSPVEEY